MKKIALLMAILFAVLLCSCEKKRIPEGKARIDVRASIYDVFKDLKDPSGKFIFRESLLGNSYFRVSVFFYKDKDNGESYLEHTLLFYLQDIKGIAAGSIDVDPGDYRVIATVDIVEKSKDKLRLEYNRVEPFRYMPEVSVVSNMESGSNNAVGYSAAGRIHLKKSGKKKEVDLQLKPLGSLITFCLYNIDPLKGDQLRLESACECSIGLPGEGDLSIEGRYCQLISPIWKVHMYRVQHYIISYNHPLSFECNGIEMKDRSGRPFNFVPGINSFIKINVSDPRVMEVYDDYIE